MLWLRVEYKVQINLTIANEKVTKYKQFNTFSIKILISERHSFEEQSLSDTVLNLCQS